MKKIILGALLLAGMATATTSCGNGDATNVNTDSIIPVELTDSVSHALGAFYGASMQDEISGLDAKDYIEGYQMMVGNNYSQAKIMGMRAGIQTATQFMMMEMDGIKVDRDIFMQEFRNYIQNKDMNDAEFAILYDRINKLQQEVMAILEKREMMRQGIAAPAEQTFPQQVEVAEVEEEVVVEEPVEAGMTSTPDTVAVN